MIQIYRDETQSWSGEMPVDIVVTQEFRKVLVPDVV
jgi:hypothetical protein